MNWPTRYKIQKEVLEREKIDIIFPRIQRSETQYADLFAREKAWEIIGIHPVSVHSLAQYSWTPESILNLTDREITAFEGIGKTVLGKLRNLKDNAEQKWQKEYEHRKQWGALLSEHLHERSRKYFEGQE